MKLVYNGREINLVECRSFFSRFKGFMFKKNINYALLFNRCNSIHTFFMKENIDVIMLDNNNVIKYYYKKVIFPKKSVYKTIELPVDYYDFNIDTKINIIV